VSGVGSRPVPCDRYARIYEVVRSIPAGRVATYGQVAELAGFPGCARQVGYALHALPEDSGLPWQRVLNARGEVSKRTEPAAEGLQRARLESDGVCFDPNGRLDLGRYGWKPRLRASGRRRARHP